MVERHALDGPFVHPTTLVAVVSVVERADDRIG